MTLTVCQIRFDCQVGPAGVVIEIPYSGVSFPQYFFFGSIVAVFFFAVRQTSSRPWHWVAR